MNLIEEKVSRNKIARKVFGVATVAALFIAAVASLPAQAPSRGVARTLSETKTEKDSDKGCLEYAVENGDPDNGPSTGLIKAAPGCEVPKHFHTAEEQLMVVRGDVLTGMDGMPEKTLGPGGFAMMPSKAVHWFTCTRKTECVMFVTFDRRYDIVWVTPQK
jgi:quercetin dioxygenase-like cupin family protein